MTMLEAFALSDVGQVRSNNEDYALILPEIGLYLLADGMGGARAGEMASRLAGSADLFNKRGRKPWASVNFITVHDGFTLNDLVSYNE